MIWKVGKILSDRRSGDYYESSKYTNIYETLFKIIQLYQTWTHKAAPAAYKDLLNNPTHARAEESQDERSASEAEGSDYGLPRRPDGGQGGGSGGGPRGGGGSRGGAGRGDGSHPTHRRKRKRDDDKPNKECQNEDEDVDIVEVDGRYRRLSHARVKRWITETSHSLYS